MNKHHPYGPSNYPAWATGCKLFRSSHTESKEASEGTKIHEEVSYWIKNGTEPDSEVARWMCKELERLSDNNEIYSEVLVNRVIDGCPRTDVFGTVDAWFYDDYGEMHIVDFKTFSDGTTDYTAQLKGYASLMFASPNEIIHLHIFHGGIFKVESVDCIYEDCINDTINLLKEVIDNASKHEPTVCKWCQYCEHIKECKAVNNAIEVVNENGLTFNNMSTCQKLVVLEAVDKLSKTIREQAKKECEDNGGVLEQDGIRYEFKAKAGKGKFNDITELASCVCQKTIFATIKDEPKSMVGLSNAELLALCDISKSKLVDILRKKNTDNGIKKVDVESLVEMFYTKGEPIQTFVRTK